MDEWGVIRKEAGLDLPYYSNIFNPLGEAETIEDLKKYKWPDPDDEGRYRGLREMAKALYNESEYAIVSEQK